MIHTKRGMDEPDPSKNYNEWATGNQKDWKKFDDNTVSNYSTTQIADDSFGGEAKNQFLKDMYEAHQGNYGESAYMLVYEKKVKKSIRQIEPSDGEEEIETLIEFNKIDKYIPDWIKNEVEQENLNVIMDR